MKDLVNEGRHLQDNFKNKLKEESTGPSKADVHYKINHPVLTILTIQDDKSGYSGSNRGTTRMQIVFGIKSGGMGQMMDLDKLMRDASIIAMDICKKLENYNTSYNSGRPIQKDDNIIVPVRVEHWTGD
jgi:hypothetical protein